MDIQTKEQLGEKFAKLSEKNPYAVIGSVLLLILVIDYFVILQFQLSTLNSLNTKIVTLKTEISQTKDNNQRLPQYRKELDKLKADVEEMSQQVRTKEEIQMIQENISRIAKDNNIMIEKIVPRASVAEPILENKEGTYSEVPIFLEGRSGYHDFGRFINQLEREEVFLKFPEFSVKASNDDPKRHKIKMTMGAVVFDKKNP